MAAVTNAEYQDLRLAHGHFAGGRRPQPDGDGRRGLFPRLRPHQEGGRRPGLPHPAALRRDQRLQAHRGDGQHRWHVLHAYAPARSAVPVRRGEAFPLGGFKTPRRRRGSRHRRQRLHGPRGQGALEKLEKSTGLSASLVDVYSLPVETDEIMQIGDD